MSITIIKNLIWIVILAMSLGYSISSIKEDLQTEYNTKLTTHIVMAIVVSILLLYECLTFRI